MKPETIPSFAFREADDGTITWGSNRRSSLYYEPIVVEYRRTMGGFWVPFQAWMRNPDGSIDMHDCDWIESSEELWHHESGGGDPYVNKYAAPEKLHGRIWIAEGVKIVDAFEHGMNPKRLPKTPLTDEALLGMGIRRVHGPTPDPISDANEGDVQWCAVCKDFVPDDELDLCCVCTECFHVHDDGLVAVNDCEHDGVFRVQGQALSLYWLDAADLVRVANFRFGDLRGDDAGHVCRECEVTILADRGLPDLGAEWAEDPESMPDERREALLGAVRERVETWVAGNQEHRVPRIHHVLAPDLAPRFGLQIGDMHTLLDEAGF